MDEELDDFLLGNAGVQCYPELPAERFMGAERGGDGDGDERAAAVIQPAAGPRVAEGVQGGQAPEVLSHRWLDLGQRKAERLAEQSLSLVQRLLIVVLADLTLAECTEFLATLASLAGAVWQMANPAPALAELYASDPALAQACVDFTPRLRHAAQVLLAGLIPSRNVR